MRWRREITLTVICALLVACGAASAGPDESLDPTIEGVGILPGSNPDADVIETEVATTVTSSTVALTTTTVAPVPPIGSLVTGNKLLMIGDSITASAAKRYGGELCDALVPLGWQVEVDAEPSRFVDFGNAVLDKRLSAKWDAAYVFLGTNYLGDQFAYRRQLERIVQRLAPTPVVLLTVTLFDDSRLEVNDAITLVSAEFPDTTRVLDWGAIAAADAAKILRGDGHHLTNDGRLALASTVAGVMGQAPAAPGKCLSTQFTNDSGASVNGDDTPPPRPVGRPTTSTTVKAQTPTASTVGGTGTVASTTASTATSTTATAVTTTQAPVTTTKPAATSTTKPATTTTKPASATTTTSVGT